MKCEFDGCANEAGEQAARGIRLCALHEEQISKLLTTEPFDTAAVVEWHVASRGGERAYARYITDDMKLRLMEAQINTKLSFDERRLASLMLRRCEEIEMMALGGMREEVSRAEALYV